MSPKVFLSSGCFEKKEKRSEPVQVSSQSSEQCYAFKRGNGVFMGLIVLHLEYASQRL